MNRKERRAAQSQSRVTPGAANAAMGNYGLALRHHQAGELEQAAALYRKVLAAVPDHVAACDRLGLVYLAQGKLRQASEQFAELARMAPQLLAQFPKVLAALKSVLPALATQLANPSAAPDLLPPQGSPAADGATSIVGDPYFQTVLKGTSISDSALERWLTAIRASALRAALAGAASDSVLPFCAALAQQCFNNEYVFTISADEAAKVESLKDMLDSASASGSTIAPLQLLAFAMYRPLNELAGADALAKRQWPEPVRDVIRQQVAESREEAALQATIPRLTPVGGGVTAEVRQQYEENPYPRWTSLAAPPNPKLLLDDHLRNIFPSTPFRLTGHADRLDILVAGCGTGRHALELAQSYRGAHVLAVDLSLASLASAKRRMPTRLAGIVEFAQADILSIGSIGRSFDFINVGGVLHHMADPLAGWRELIKLMKPDGVMQVGLYSRHARRDIVATRELIAQRGYRGTADDIRRLRQDLRDKNENFPFMQLMDFFSVSAVRDLLFHVHETQITIPEIKAFLAEAGLNFIGFDFHPPELQQQFRGLFARNGWSLTDLDRWDALERENPNLFVGMYIFWVQKA